MLRFKHSARIVKQTVAAKNSLQGSQSSAWITSFNSRNFALFQATKIVSPQTQQHAPQRQEQKPKDYHEVVKSIETTRRKIADKTKQGRELSKQIGREAEADKYVKYQRYEIFINKMEQLYRSELKYKKRQTKKLHQMQQAHVYSQQPLRDILQFYNALSVRGFESSAIVESLKMVGKALRGRGGQALEYNDYTVTELYQSYHMQKLVDDIKFGLQPHTYFNPLHLAQTSELLGDLGYKSTELIPLFFEKLTALVEEMYSGVNHQKEFTFEDAVYGGMKNQVARHYVFQGFQTSEEFNQHMTTLLEWENSPVTEAPKEISEIEGEVQEMEDAIQDVIKAAVQVKELQMDYQSSIDSLRQQYFKMQEASDKHQFLVDNPYIKYDLLELQEMLVNAGYIDPIEQSTKILQESTDDRMRRAANVFYDYVLNYQPELLSPQHEQFYKTAKENETPKEQPNLEETQNIISLRTLSQTLTGLSKQAMSYYKDVVLKDYLHEFYEQYLEPNDKTLGKYFETEKLKYPQVMMEREYLRAWKIFREQSEKFFPIIEDLVATRPDDLEGMLYALQGLNSIRYDALPLREQIVSNALRLLQDASNVSQEALVEALKGVAHNSQEVTGQKELQNQLRDRINPDELNYQQQLDTLWSLALLGDINSKTAQSIIKSFNSLSFERIEHDLPYEEYLKLLDVFNAQKLEGDESSQFTNKRLLLALEGNEFVVETKYLESNSQYDPFKKRVVQALTKGLSDAAITHQSLVENDLYYQQKVETDFLHQEQYPYKPDIVMGYKGKKVGLFVLPERKVFRDTNRPDGVQNFRMRMVAKASQDQVHTAQLAIPQVVKYDIEDLKIQLNSNFRLQEELDRQVAGDHTAEVNFNLISDFGSKMLQQAATYSESLSSQKELAKFDTFIHQITRLFQIKQQLELRFDPVQKAVSVDNLKVNLMKLDLMFQNLSSESKNFVSKFLPQGQTFTDLLQQVLSTIKTPQHVEEVADSQISSSWVGTRFEVELPVTQKEMTKKSIIPEIINQRFMWVDDYFHYQDWKNKLKETYDNFNLLVIPRHKNTPKFFFDKESNKRIVPQGVFPFPNHKRQIMLPTVNAFNNSLINHPGNDEFTLFEKEPFKMMVMNELKKAETLKPIKGDVSMIANLQNLKQGLKSDYTDKEILNIILLNLNFTDQLIEEHLGLKKPPLNKSFRLVERDAESYREFVSNTYSSKDIEDPYTHFFLKEAAKKERAKKLWEEEKQQELLDDQIRDRKELEKIKERKEIWQDKIDRMLIENELENEDITSLSHALPSNVNVNYDLSSLIKTEYLYDVEPELLDKTMSAETFLDLKRRQAEAKLIKTKIIYKLYEGHTDLSPLEKTYIQHWITDLQHGKDRNILNLRESMVPKKHSQLALGDIEAKNFYTLNSIPKVDLNRQLHKNYAVNDLVLELSHFLDEEVVNKVEMEIFQERIKFQWNLSNNFKLVETRNKEIGLVIDELEELAWRMAGMISGEELTTIKKMVSIQRNQDLFDREFYDNDMKSMEQFVEAVNTYDNRINLVEQWIVRKEDEFKSRVNRPPAHLKKPDSELYAQINKPTKEAREKLVSRLLSADEFGNKIEKNYKDITSKELNTLTEGLCLRFYLFNYDYPPFLFQAVKGIMEHPNLQKSDRDMLDAYCRVFEVDWKGIKEVEQNKEFLFSHPIHVEGSNVKAYGLVDDVKVKEMLKRACVPFVEQVASTLLSYK